MEQKRLLWIIAAVGVFLLVVLGAALMIYSPATKNPQSIAAANNGNKNTSNGWISLAPAQAETTEMPFAAQSDPNLLNDENADSEFNAGNADSSARTGFDFETETPNDIRVKDLTVHAENATIYAKTNTESKTLTAPAVNTTTTIDLNPPAQVSQIKTETVVTSNTVAKNNIAAEKTAEKSYADKVKTNVKVTEQKKVAAKPAKTVQKPAAKVEPKKPMITRYWVQVSSLTSRKSADAAREELAKNQITADVFTYTDKKNQMYYRVRVGPYTTKTEAEYWCGKIAKIDTFKNSAGYVTSTTTED
ncbi:MAG: SPOR domain-containing protein [Treponema sp.]|nr:SPOR domain-containing protein [Treponema sp.]